MKNIIQFFKEVYAEFKRVTWPTREEVMAKTKIAIVSIIVIALILGTIDYVTRNLISYVLNSLG